MKMEFENNTFGEGVKLEHIQDLTKARFPAKNESTCSGHISETSHIGVFPFFLPMFLPMYTCKN